MDLPTAADAEQLSLVRELIGTQIPLNRDLGVTVLDLGAGRPVLARERAGER